MKNLILIWSLLLSYMAFGQSTSSDAQYTSNGNMLINPSFEQGRKAWVSTAGTVSITKVSGEFSHLNSALKVALSAQAMNVSQTVTTVAGIQKQGYVRVLYKVPAIMADFQVCTLVDAVEQNCVPSDRLVLDNTYRSVEIPLIFGTTSAGIKFKTTSSYTANAFFDSAVVAQGLATQNLMLDNVYSLTSNAGSISLLSKTGWVTSCTSSSTSVCTFASGLFTQAPNCTVTTDNALTTVQGAQITAVSSSSVSVTQVAQASGTPVNGKFFLLCQKSGNDYLSSSANVYSSTNGNYSYTNGGTITIGATTTPPTKGTIVTDRVLYQRNGQNIKAIYQYDQSAAGSNGSGDYLYSLPAGLSFDTSLITPYSTVGAPIAASEAKAIVGFGEWTDGTNAVSAVKLIAYSSTQFRLLGNLGSSKAFTSSSYLNFGLPLGLGLVIDAPISGWSNSNVIVGSFAGVPAVPGYQGKVDTFSVSYGTGSATTMCTASPCSYLDQIGNAVTSVSRSTNGSYSLNTARTYTKLKCTQNAKYSTNGLWSDFINGANTNTFPFNVYITSGALTDSYGTLTCIGSY